jgi:hypothetical protein
LGVVIAEALWIGRRGTQASSFSCCGSSKEPVCASSSIHEFGGAFTKVVWKAVSEFDRAMARSNLERNASDRLQKPLYHWLRVVKLRRLVAILAT